MIRSENSAFPLIVRKMAKPDVEAEMRSALEIVKLRGFESRKLGHLFGGKQRRVAAARALVFDPELVLMD
jgi:ABC-type sugar transport system ATPase subunit